MVQTGCDFSPWLSRSRHPSLFTLIITINSASRRRRRRSGLDEAAPVTAKACSVRVRCNLGDEKWNRTGEDVRTWAAGRTRDASFPFAISGSIRRDWFRRSPRSRFDGRADSNLISQQENLHDRTADLTFLDYFWLITWPFFGRFVHI